LVTESQNGRDWKGPLWVIESNPPAEAGSPTAGLRFKVTVYSSKCDNGRNWEIWNEKKKFNK